MSKYDELMAKVIETGDFTAFNDFTAGQAFGCEDLDKSHVKAHFRRDKNGKLQFIQDYDDARHKNEVHHQVHQHKRFKVNKVTHRGPAYLK